MVGWIERPMLADAARGWQPLTALLLLCALASAAVGCDSAETDSTDTVTLDAADTQDIAELAPTCPGTIGCACSSDAECPAISQCISVGESEKRCAAPCAVGKVCSSAGYVCRSIAKGGSTLDLCVVPLTVGCQPCTTDAECNTGVEALARCAGIVDGTGAAGTFCTDACNNDEGCPSGYVCDFAALTTGATARVCRPKSNTCACSAQSIAANRATTCRIAACVGSRQCGADGLTACAVTTTDEICNGTDDDCDGETDEEPLLLCNDDEPCTGDSCKGKLGCEFQALNGPCDDSNACTESDTCKVSACLGTAVSCDDNNDCTTDSCDKVSGCQHVAFAGACEDGDACTSGDACSGTTCSSGSAVDCDDGEVCTADACDPASGCGHLPANEPCTDDNVCTAGDACDAGACAATPISCDDGNGCTLDACDPVTGCAHLPDDATICGALNLPLSLPLDCESPSWKPWLTAKAGVGFGWSYGPGSPTPVTEGQCALHAAPVPSCSAGAWTTSATLGPVAVGTLPLGSKITVSLESGGLIAGVSLKVQGSVNGSTWSTIGTVPATGTQWGKAAYPFTAVAGASTAKQVYVRLLLEGSTCPSPDDTGWYIRNFAVYLDTCAVNNGGCDAKAKCTAQTDSSTACVCNKGYEGDGKTCVDIDECTVNTDNCVGVAVCNNTAGSFQCSCPSGYSQTSPTTCADIDECDLGTKVCGAKEVCVNQVPGASCACAPGYTGEPGACLDVNECELGTHNCSPNGKCTNQIGNYICSCKPGYTGDGKTCTDLDECKTGQNQCSVNADCYNLQPGFYCMCKTGYKDESGSGDPGTVCKPK